MRRRLPWTLSVVLLFAVSARAQQRIDSDGDGWLERAKRFVWGTPPAPPQPPQAVPVVPVPVPVQAPAPVVRIVSWNLQTFGKHIHAERQRASARAMASIFADPETKVLAAQEIADDDGADIVQNELPSGGHWTRSFENSSDAQDNGIFARDGARIECSAFLFADRAKSRHPARAAHIRIGDLDFTIVTLHLAYDHGHADHALDELRSVLDWVKAQQARGGDPDVIVAGDFNLPTRAGKAASHRAHDAQWKPIDDVLAEYPSLGLTALVDEPTSRQNGEAANNYDHFLITHHLAATAYMQGSAARMPEGSIKAIEAAEGTEISDHFPISAELRSGGAGNDGQAIRPDGGNSCPL